MPEQPLGGIPLGFGIVVEDKLSCSCQSCWKVWLSGLVLPILSAITRTYDKHVQNSMEYHIFVARHC